MFESLLDSMEANLIRVCGKSGMKMIIIGNYVNDCLINGKEKSIDHLIDEMKRNEFDLKV
jgi:hypothetical protein